MPATFEFDGSLLSQECATALPGVALRRLGPADAAGMAAALNDLSVARNLVAVPHPYGIEDAQEFLDGPAASPRMLPAAVHVDGAFAGCVAVDALNGPPELGYWIAPAYWGRGVASAATRALVDLVFAMTGLDRLVSGHFVDNEASAAVLAKLGFGRSGVIEQHSRARKESVRLVAMALTRAEWLARQPSIETARLALSPPTVKDADELALLAADRSLGLMTAAIPKPFTLEDARAFVLRAARKARPASMTFSIRARETGELMGGLGWSAGEHRVAEVGYWLGAAHRGQGIATEAARAAIEAVFDWTDAVAVTARCRVANPASRGVLERCGFQWDGASLVRAHDAPGSVAVDVFRLDRDVFLSLKAWGQSSARNGGRSGMDRVDAGKVPAA